MPENLQQRVETRLTVIDKAGGPLGKVAEKADHLYSVFSGLVPLAGGLGAALSLKGVVATTEQYIKRVEQVTKLTGAAAEQTDFLFSAARKAGVEYQAMEGVMFRLSRRGAMMEQTLATSTGKTLPTMAQRFRKMGVDVTRGPVSAIAQMAAGVKRGTIDTSLLMQEFQIPPAAVNDFKGFLEDLDEAAMAKAVAEKGRFISAEDLKSFSRLGDAQNRIADTWTRMQVVVGRRLLPVFADLVERVADKLENEWLPAAAKFGQMLADNMDKILSTAKAFVAVMTAKKLLNVLTSLSSKEGILGQLASGGIGGLLKGGGFGLGGVVGQVSSVVSTLVAAGPALLVVAAAAGAAYLGYRAIQSNIDGVKDRLLALWEGMKSRVALVGEQLSVLWEKVAGLFGIQTGFFETVGAHVARVFETTVRRVDLFLHAVQTAISFLGELGDQFAYTWREYLAKPWREYVVDPFLQSMKWVREAVGKLWESAQRVARWVGLDVGTREARAAGFDLGFLEEPVAMWQRHWEKTQQATDALTTRRLREEAAAAKLRKAAEREAPAQKPPAPNFDFRGSRFDITQKFAEGFDPDRIAVAFANDLSRLGELRAQSGFTPLYAVR